jgi:hypothetical protein
MCQNVPFVLICFQASAAPRLARKLSTNLKKIYVLAQQHLEFNLYFYYKTISVSSVYGIDKKGKRVLVKNNCEKLCLNKTFK